MKRWLAILFSLPLAAGEFDFFESRIRPLLVDRCYECHSADAKKIRGELVLDSRAGTMKGGASGPVIKPGDPDNSPLIKAVRRIDPDSAMPPKTKLTTEEVAALEEWVRMGAPDPRTNSVTVATSAIDWMKARQWWSFQPIQRPPLPAVKNKRWPQNPIDHFILARLEREKLSPALNADKRVLLRRATYDLIGLPPTPTELESFLNDPSPDAFAKVIDRLLESPHYGERWGRHWLDVVRYADSAGDNSDFPIPQMYRYRNWVIDAFNNDLPYNEFIRQQLAGDLLPHSSVEEKNDKLIATGYLANARRFGSRVSDYPQHLTIEDTIDNLGRAFLGLTINCARCHDHKFDPIPTSDYYALYGIFESTRYPWPGIELEQQQRDLVPLVDEGIVSSVKKSRSEKQKSLDAEVKRLEAEIKEATDDKKKDLEKKLAEAKKSADQHRKSALPYEQAYAVADASKIVDAKIQIKGDPTKSGDTVPRRFLTILGGAQLPAEIKNSGRLTLANWIADPANPLTARVMVNRIWNYHFGKGLVPTPNDFGKQGKPPTHHELLDYLAARFIDSGWSIKSIHRLIMLSQGYQLSSEPTELARARDPNNDLLSAFPRRRLDAESMRDTLLALANNLDSTPGGAHPFPPQEQWNFTQHNPFKAVYDTPRRSVYLMTQRIQRHPFMAIYDGADPAASTPQRLTSTTPLQALYLLNDPFIHEQSKAFARRVLAEAHTDEARIRKAYQLALSRAPTSGELKESEKFLGAMRAKLLKTSSPAEIHAVLAYQAFARSIFRLNEFVYID